MRSGEGATALHYAAGGGHVDSVEWLLGRSENKRLHRDNDGGTAVHDAAQFGQVEVLKVFIRHRLNMEVTDDDGQTPLDIAKENNHDDCVELLYKEKSTMKKTDLNLLRPASAIRKASDNTLRRTRRRSSGTSWSQHAATLTPIEMSDAAVLDVTTAEIEGQVNFAPSKNEDVFVLSPVSPSIMSEEENRQRKRSLHFIFPGRRKKKSASKTSLSDLPSTDQTSPPSAEKKHRRPRLKLPKVRAPWRRFSTETDNPTSSPPNSPTSEQDEWVVSEEDENLPKEENPLAKMSEKEVLEVEDKEDREKLDTPTPAPTPKESNKERDERKRHQFEKLYFKGQAADGKEKEEVEDSGDGEKTQPAVVPQLEETTSNDSPPVDKVPGDEQVGQQAGDVTVSAENVQPNISEIAGKAAKESLMEIENKGPSLQSVLNTSDVVDIAPIKPVLGGESEETPNTNTGTTKDEIDTAEMEPPAEIQGRTNCVASTSVSEDHNEDKEGREQASDAILEAGLEGERKINSVSEEQQSGEICTTADFEKEATDEPDSSVPNLAPRKTDVSVETDEVSEEEHTVPASEQPRPTMNSADGRQVGGEPLKQDIASTKDKT